MSKCGIDLGLRPSCDGALKLQLQKAIAEPLAPVFPRRSLALGRVEANPVGGRDRLQRVVAEHGPRHVPRRVVGRQVAARRGERLQVDGPQKLAMPGEYR